MLSEAGEPWLKAPPPQVCVAVLSHVWLFATPWTVACQVPLSMVIPREEYWSLLPFPSPGDLPDPGIEPGYPPLQQILYHLTHQGSPKLKVIMSWSLFPKSDVEVYIQLMQYWIKSSATKLYFISPLSLYIKQVELNLHELIENIMWLNFKWSCFIITNHHNLLKHAETCNFSCCSVTLSCMTLQPHGPQHDRLPCPSPSPGICQSSCWLHQWCHPAI